MTLKELTPILPIRFISFLQSENLYISYCYHTVDWFTHNPEALDGFKETIRERKSHIVNASFSWSNTPEGFPFWSAVSVKWHNVPQNSLQLTNNLTTEL